MALISKKLQAVESDNGANEAAYPYGIPGLDVYSDGEREGKARLIPGAAPGWLTVVTGLSGSGKTTSTAHMVISFANAGRRVLYGAWEQGAGMTLELLATLSLELSRTDVMTGQYTEEEQREIEHEMERIGQFVRFFELPFGRVANGERVYNDRNLDLIQSHIAEVGPDLFVADLFKYALQQTAPDDEELALRRMLGMTQQEKCHTILVQQLRGKDLEAREDKRPTREGVKGSGSWIEVPDTVIGWHRPALFKSVPDDKIQAIILKQRYGQWPLAVELEWEPEFGRIGAGSSIDYDRPGEVGEMEPMALISKKLQAVESDNGANEAARTAGPRYLVTLGQLSSAATQETLDDVCRRMIVENGGDGTGLKVEEVQPVQLVVAPAPPAPESPVVTKVLEDGVNLARLTQQEEVAAGAGFSPKPPMYALGTRVNELGVENARRSRVEHDAKPTVQQAMVALRDQVALENRRDRVVRLSDVRMRNDGVLTVRVPANGKPAHVVQLGLAARAFDSFCQRSGVKGADYLKRCWPELRAHNVNEWLSYLGKEDPEAALTFRLRDNPKVATSGKREVFAVVSEKYQGGFSVDQIAEAIAEFAPDGARGAVDYDGFRAKIECLWHSDVDAEQYCAGEMFKAGIVVRTDDTGSGSINVSAVVWRNLCLNLICIDEATVEVGRIRHVGDLSKLAARFYEAGAVALNKLAGFRQAWGYAQQESVTAGNEECTDLSIAQVLPGLFNGALERELVPVRGRRPEVLKALVQAYEREPVKHTEVTRSDMVNAFTRYAHETESDPFRAFEIEKAAGSLLFGRAAKQRWPYEPLSA